MTTETKQKADAGNFTELGVSGYEVKPEFGAGFRGRVIARATGLESTLLAYSEGLFPTQHAAFMWAHDEAMKAIGERGYAVGHYRGEKYKKNYFVA